MNLRRPPSACILALALGLLASTSATGAGAVGETWTIGDRTYTQVRVRATTGGTVTIFHGGGISEIEIEKLPPELQTRFNYDPEKSEAWRRDAAAGMESTRELRRRAEEARARIQAEEQEVRNSLSGYDSAAPSSSAPKETISVEVREKVDLRSDYSNYGLYFKNQGRRPSCAVFAVVSAVEYELARTQGLPSPLSEEFLIWAVRTLQPGIPIDDGFHFREVVAALQAYGLPRQSTMPNTFGRPIDDIEPTQAAIFEASTRRNIVPVWYRHDDPDLIARIVHALNNGTPVVVGLRWPNWRTLQGNHLLRNQRPRSGPGHAVTLVGYDAPDQNPENIVFIFRNSYGIDWGLGGCGFVADSYLKENLLGAFHVTIANPVATAVR